MKMARNELDTIGLDTVQFGEEIRAKEFCLSPDSGFINNGALGVVPRRILEIQKKYLDQMESHPDHWFRRTVYELWNQARQAVADFVGADVEDVVFVVNATAGVNTVLRSCKFNPGDAILGTSLTYRSLKNLWDDMVEHISPGVEGLLMEIKIPIVSEDDLVQQYDDYLTQHPNVKFVLLDHITSFSSILMPMERIAAVCRKHGAMVMVDGAHAVGQLPLNLKELDVDFYTGSLHKWLYTPRGCAFLWVKREHHGMVRPPLTSGMKRKSLSGQFFHQGTCDHVPFVCAKHALQFYQAIGGMDKIVGYISNLATRGRDLLVEELGLEPMAIPASMESPNLRMPRLPGVPKTCLSLKEKEARLKAQTEMYEESDLETTFAWVDGVLYLRLSLQVHNTLDDIRRLASAMKRVLATCVPYEDY